MTKGDPFGATVRGADALREELLGMSLKRFRAKWRPVRLKKTHQNKGLFRSDSI